MPPQNKKCQNCKNDFVIESEDFLFYEKIKVPPPTWCPECRMLRRTSFRNLRSLHRRNCGLCQKPTINMYHNDDVCTVYCNSCWNSDAWDPASYGIEIDWSKPFLLQWQELFTKVPRFALLHNGAMTDSDYTNYSVSNKNCYLSYSVTNCEDVRYSENIDKTRNSLDNLYLYESDMCYENTDCVKNYRTHFALNSKSCIDSWFIFDCVNCQNCFMSSGLRNKQYVLNNEQLSREEYFRRMSEIKTSSNEVIGELKRIFKNMVEHSSIHRYAHIIGSNNAIGDHINNSNNISNSFGIDNSENIKYCNRILGGSKDCMDVYGLMGASLIYDSFTISVQTNACAFSFLCLSAVSEVQYSAFCNSSNNLFGCVSIKKGSYMILNKQYTKEEYKELLPKLIQHMNDMPYVDGKGRVYKYGEFFPMDFSPFGINETIAYDLFTPTKNAAETLGYKWKDPDDKVHKITIEAKDLKDDIRDIESSITEEVIGCLHSQTCTDQCTKGFKILAKDLYFYKNNNLPLPRLCPNCRHYERLKYRNPVKLWHRACMKEGCKNEFETTYAPDRPEIVYCEKCYQQEVY